MLLIAHRGNLNGPNPERENSPQYIKEALFFKFDIEVDVWHLDNQWWLGHDKPQYPIVEDFLFNTHLWCHAKNIEAFALLTKKAVHCFWHQNDDYTLTSRKRIWVYPGQPLVAGSIAVMPEGHYNDNQLKICDGICSDYVSELRAVWQPDLVERS